MESYNSSTVLGTERALSLLDLPNEIILSIVEKLPRARDLGAVAKTNKSLHGLVNRQLYRFDLRSHSNLALSWAAENGVEGTARNSLAAGASSDLVKRPPRPFVPDPPLLFLLRDAPRHKILRGFQFSYLYRSTMDVSGITPLQIAIGCKQEGVAKLLVENGADINVVYPAAMNQSTLLHLACGHGLVDTVKLLISRGANIEALDSRSQTPIFYATKRNDLRSRSAGHVATLEFLLARGANFKARDRRDRIPMDLLMPRPPGSDFMMGREWSAEQRAVDRRTEERLKHILHVEETMIRTARVLSECQAAIERRKKKRKREGDEGGDGEDVWSQEGSQ